MELPFKLKAIPWKGSIISHTDDTSSAVRSSVRLVFGGAPTLILSALSLSYSNLSHLTAFCADLTRDSSDSWCICDVICSTRGVVTCLKKCTLDLLPGMDFQGTGFPGLLEALGCPCHFLSYEEIMLLTKFDSFEIEIAQI